MLPYEIARVASAALNVYTVILIVRALMSWFNPNPHNKAVQFVYQITEPLLAPVRRVLPPLGGMDFSIVVVIIGLNFLGNLLIGY